MEAVQDWLQLIIIFALAISNIVFIRIYRKEIESLKSRNAELEKTNKAALDLSNASLGEAKMFKDLHDPKVFKEFLEMKVQVEVKKAIEKQQADLNNKQIKELIEYLEESYNFISFYCFEKKFDRDKRIKFIHAFFDKSKNFVWAVTNSKIERVEKQINQNQLETPAS